MSERSLILEERRVSPFPFHPSFGRRLEGCLPLNACTLSWYPEQRTKAEVPTPTRRLSLNNERASSRAHPLSSLLPLSPQTTLDVNNQKPSRHKEKQIRCSLPPPLSSSSLLSLRKHGLIDLVPPSSSGRVPLFMSESEDRSFDEKTLDLLDGHLDSLRKEKTKSVSGLFEERDERRGRSNDSPIHRSTR